MGPQSEDCNVKYDKKHHGERGKKVKKVKRKCADDARLLGTCTYYAHATELAEVSTVSSALNELKSRQL